MKALFCILSLSITTCFAGIKESDLPYYKITGEIKNKSLIKGTARLKIKFEEHSGLCLKSRVNVKLKDGYAPQPALDSLGQCVVDVPTGNYSIAFEAYDCDAIVTGKINFTSYLELDIFVHFHSNSSIIEADKPVIYLYPDQPTDVSVLLTTKGQLDFTYPQYPPDGWIVKAYPNGTLETGNRQYNYLFWEGQMNVSDITTDYQKGFVVEKENLFGFLENVLARLGLNEKEAADFITYWGPRMLPHEKVYIHFLMTNEYDQVGSLTVNPKPDNALRIFMLWKVLDKNSKLNPLPQLFTPFKREGFTLVEWGGSEIPAVNGM